MNEQTTIQIDKNILERLKTTKEYPRQTYNELLDKLISVFVAVKKRNSYDEFLHKIQQQKMRELWGNKDDEVWDNV